ncbi:MAG: stage II sporulation protein M, partial [bacterium]|nr:stage II sporulation protein M [bacterium]
ILDELDHNSFKNLPPEYLVELGKLYHETLSDLGEIRAASDDPQLKLHLNNLLGRAYGHIYQKKRLKFSDFVDFFTTGFPRLFRRRIHFVVVAALIFVFSSLIGFLCITRESKLVTLVVPESWRMALEKDLAEGKIGRDFPNQLKTVISKKIMFNNIRVSFYAFATGFLLGAGTVHIIIINGLLLGGLASIYYEGGYSFEFWALILPHGVIELLAIFICSGAGLILGYAIINPGPYRRRDWFRHEGLAAVRLVVGCIPLFVIAALVETYITPADIGDPAKYFISLILFTATLAYLALSGLDSFTIDNFARSFQLPNGADVRVSDTT